MTPAASPVPHLHHLRHLATETSRFREVLAQAPSGARVPTCPDWDADDLLWHLAEVQWHWGEVAERRITDGADLDEMNRAREPRPADRAGLLAFFDRCAQRLQRELAGLDPDTELWMWADEHTAGYIARRQAHEALIHRIDAELTAGAPRAPIDSLLAADGVDEALRVMRGFEAEPGFSAEPLGGSVTIAVVDDMHVWTVTPLRVQGSDDDGQVWDVMRFRVTDGPDANSVAQVCGTAADLDCWLWNRPTAGEISRQGDTGALALVDEVLGSSID